MSRFEFGGMWLGDRVVGKFIIIVFGFLGFSFYELSGGSDFDGEALRLSRVDAAPAQQGLPKINVTKSIIVDTKTDSAVTRASFSMVSVDKLDTQAEVKQASFAPVQVKDTAPAIVLPSLVGNPETIAMSQETIPAYDRNLHVVVGNLVNVRGGPGTNFDVVGKLTRGTEVEVLAENGDGWVEMRSVDGATLGWMADFLLNES
tara:strand:- start:147 stop:755 length:609 start_codon:yes stop_codon:yes gene_type:complete